MKNSLQLSAIILVTLLFSVPFTSFASESVEQLPDLQMVVPKNDQHREYLGLAGEPGDTFSLSDIEADVLLIELFSMYCPFCQDEAPAINNLYQAMVEFSKAGYTVKMIGIGANNSEFEVDHFRETYGVPFPLFADPEMKLYKALGGKGTPGFIGGKKGEDNMYTIILRQSGGFYHVDEFFNELLRKSGYK